MTKEKELHDTATKFIRAFEQVFDEDWTYTKQNLGIWEKPTHLDDENSIPFISNDGTFLNPKVDDETENWGHRAILLDQYRALKKLLSDN